MKRNNLALAAFLACGCSAVMAELVNMRVYNFDFSATPSGPPVDPVINVGDTVRWTWMGGFHDVTSVAGDSETFASDTMFVVGSTFEHTFTQPGVHWYYCSVHGFDNGNGTSGGMSGTITVLSPPTPVTISVSSAPQAGVAITVTPEDNQGRGDGVTPFAREYNQNTSVTFTAPLRPAGLAFWRWRQNNIPGAPDVAALTISPSANTAIEAEYVRLGDMNGDGEVNNFDIDAFVLALVDPDGYAAAFPGLDRVRRGDIDGDGEMNNFDIDPFVSILIGG